MSTWGGNALNIFKWKTPKDTSLAASLLNNATPEVELSQYWKLSPGSESPSELLDGDRLNVEPIADLDLFFERLYSLHVTDCELQTMPWPTILEKVVRVQTMHQLCVVKDLTAQEIIMRLMRKENYLIGMINQGILAFPISKWISGAGTTAKSSPYKGRHRLILTKTLERTLNWSIL